LAACGEADILHIFVCYTVARGLPTETGDWNLAVKYEFNTDIRLKNEAANSLSAKNLPQLAQFRDGEKVSDDMPALLGIGAQYSPIDRLRLSAGYHYYFDKQSSKFNHEEKLLRRGTYEILAGAEYDFSKLVTAGFG